MVMSLGYRAHGFKGTGGVPGFDSMEYIVMRVPGYSICSFSLPVHLRPNIITKLSYGTKPLNTSTTQSLSLITLIAN